MKQKIGIVIPCYNEEERLDLEKIYAELKLNNFLYKILLVDDGSLDNTSNIIENFCSNKRNKDHFSSLILKYNSGKGEAVRMGMNVLYDQDYDLIGFLDADMAAPLSSFNEMLEILDKDENVKCVIGSRVKLCGKDIRRFAWRHYFGRLFVTVMNIILKTDEIYDTQCGAKLFRRNTLKNTLDKRFESKWLFDVELLLRIKNKVNLGFSEWLFEMPLKRWYEIPGSKVTALSFFKTLFDIYKIVIKYRIYG